MSKRISKMMLVVLGMALLASCSGGGGGVTPPDFTRMTARVIGTDGSPLTDLVVRVEGGGLG